MTFYADQPARRTRQILGDVMVALWVVLWVLVGRQVHAVISRLAAPGRTMEDAGTSMAEGLEDAGAGMGQVPLLGEQLRAPLDAAGGAAESFAEAGVSLQEGVAQAALLAGLAVAGWPIVVVLALWLWSRLRFARRAAAARHLLAADAGLDLFALRALARLPLPVLAGVSGDPAAAWRRGDPEVVRRLAALELEAAGVEVAQGRTTAPRP